MPTCPKCEETNPELGARCPRDGYYYIYDDAVQDAAGDHWLGRQAADKYVVLSRIDEGGMGAVYRAMQLPVQREVAFKVLRAELEDSAESRDRFEREARAISKLSHPNIITMHDFGVDDDHPFMVMEYAPGQSLADWMVQPDLSLSRICHVFRQILSALAEAHQKQVVHRDLKPENLIITRTGQDGDLVKLLDFGIARMIHDGATRGLTREGEVFGTPHYMAPEQAQGQTDIGPPADVYALGVMFFELLSGHPPFNAPTPLSILYMHLNDDMPALDPRDGLSVPDRLRHIIERATAKDKSARFQSAGEMLGALDAVLGNASGPYSAPADDQDGQQVTQKIDAPNSTNEGSQADVGDDTAKAATLLFGDVDAGDADAGAGHSDQDASPADVAHPAGALEQAPSTASSDNDVSPDDDMAYDIATEDLGRVGADSTQKIIGAVLAAALLLGIGSVVIWLTGTGETADDGAVSATPPAAGSTGKARPEAAADKSDQPVAAPPVADPELDAPDPQPDRPNTPAGSKNQASNETDSLPPAPANPANPANSADGSPPTAADRPSAGSSGSPAAGPETRRAGRRDPESAGAESDGPKPSPDQPAVKLKPPKKFEPQKFQAKPANTDDPTSADSDDDDGVPKKWD